MNRTLYLILFVALLCVGSASAQMAVFRDSTEFDTAFARLRDIDFEDVYSMTLQRITFRNPYGLHSHSNDIPDEEGNYPDTADIYLDISQGATLDLPTRTRSIHLVGGANPFSVRVTDFNDSVYTTSLDTFPITLSSETGIRRVQFLGTDGSGNDDINWRGALLEVATFDENGDTLAYTDFDELEADRFYLVGVPHHSYIFIPDSNMTGPVEWHGVTFNEDYYGFNGTHLSYFEARVDPDNPIGNLALDITPGATIDFAEGVEGALLSFEGLQLLDTFYFEVTDYAGEVDTVMETGWGRTYDTTWVEDQRVTYAHLGFGSPAGIKQIRLLEAWHTQYTRDWNDSLTGTETFYSSLLLAAVHLAEIPQNEIQGITQLVTDLDTAGFLGADSYSRLNDRLQGAIQSVDGGDRSGAVAQLHTFRDDVQELFSKNVLVSEEARTLLDDAAYVISRLGGSAGLEASAAAAHSARAILLEPIVSAESMRIRYSVPSGITPSITLSNLRGEFIRRLAPDESGDGIGVWDLRDDEGRAVPSGIYLITLHAGGESATRKVQMVR